MRVRGLLTCLLLPLLLAADTARPTPAGLALFEQKVRPVLLKHCYGCHSAEAKKARGGLVVDTRAGLLAGGDTGPAVVPGKPGESLLLKALRHAGPAMPPKDRLADAVVADFEKWIALGAPDPRDGTAKASLPDIDLVKGRQFWAFVPPRRHAAPVVRDTHWPRSSVDRFLLAKLEAHGLRPVADAPRETLLRRVFLDLTGLPPAIEEMDAFLADDSPLALPRLVDALLASPAFGERWGRHWLDVVRYADSNGKDENLTYHEAYLYRDYVLRAFAADKPFADLIREQVAGDLLPAVDQPQREERLTATGFLVVGPKVLADRDQPRRLMDVVDEQVDTIGKAFLGLTLGCARCHDHKFDPVPTADYYALAGILTSTHTLDGFKLGNPVVAGWTLRPLDAASEKLVIANAEHDAKLKKMAAEVAKVKKGEDKQRLRELEAEEKRLKDARPAAPRLAMAVRDVPKPADAAVAVRGNVHQPGATVPRGFLRVAAWDGQPRVNPAQSGRRELAAWLADDRNPLTARVLVNRVWLHLFGEGLVRTPDNFGAQGERPSHQELLDTLAVEFMADGWSVKRLVRRLVLSRAYGLSVGRDANAAKVDPENRLLWRAHRRRLQAEVLRDGMLAVAGTLDRRPGVTPVPGLGERAIDNNSKGGVPTDRNHLRGVYLPVIRNDLPGIFEVFDFADPDVTTGRREATTVPTQALYLLNSPFVLDQARSAAARLVSETQDDAERVVLLYRRALGRGPTAEEVRRSVAFVRDGGDWAGVCQAVFGCTEFRYVE